MESCFQEEIIRGCFKRDQANFSRGVKKKLNKDFRPYVINRNFANLEVLPDVDQKIFCVQKFLNCGQCIALKEC